MNYLIDPNNITKFDCSEHELQLVLLFWIAAAGKKASTSAKCLESLMFHGLEKFETLEPFEIIRRFGNELSEVLKIHGFGCFNNKAKSMMDLVSRDLDLFSCSVSDLEEVRGIGPKTARCFLMHSRKNVRYAGLDTHVLKYMRDNGVNVPKSTPSGKKYLELEKIFLEMADASGKSLAEFDLDIWRRYSSRRINVS